MGGKGGSSSNSQMVAFQQQQAEQARQKEVQREARLKTGSDYINSLFDGTPSGAKSLDLSSLASADPNSGGYQYDPATGQYTSGFQLADGYRAGTTPDAGAGAGWGIYDKDNNLLTSAKSLADLSKQHVQYGGDPNTRTGGVDNAFYDKFRQANLDYYMPELDRQFASAKSDLNFGLARAGTLRSSTANQSLADLMYENDVNKAQMTAQADASTGELRNTVAANKSAAINQLYSTEDPTLAANTATGLVRNVELTQPQLNPIGELFKPIAIGLGGGLQGYSGQQAYNRFTGAANGSNGSSGKTYTG